MNLLAALANRVLKRPVEARDAAAEADARDWLATVRPTTHPYANGQPTWWGGPDIGIEADLGYEDERNDR